MHERFFLIPAYIVNLQSKSLYQIQRKKLRNGRNKLNIWSIINSTEVVEALVCHLDKISIRFGSKLYRQIVGIPLGNNCALLLADLFHFALRETSLVILQRKDKTT